MFFPLLLLFLSFYRIKREEGEKNFSSKLQKVSNI